MASGDRSELRCPVDDAGLFTQDVGVPSLVGKSVLGDGVDEMIRLLEHDNTLLAEQPIEHRYPHDWKSKEPIIVRATPQWFADVTSIKPMVQKALDKVEFYPPQCELNTVPS
jgi:isoleucyl-tRNA synthetase